MAYRSIFQDAIDSIGGLLDDEDLQRGIGARDFSRAVASGPADDVVSGGERQGVQDGFRVGWKVVDHADANGGGRTDYGDPNQSLVVTAYLPEDYLPRDLMRESLEDLARYSLLAIPAGHGGRIAANGAGAIWRAAREGRELRIGDDLRLAPFGNRTGHQYGKYPHYHRRGTIEGQGIGRHRPWETKGPDTSWWHRF